MEALPPEDPDDDALVRTLRDVLPAIVDPTDPPSVLVLGGGGRLAFWLAARGYAPTLVSSGDRVEAARREMRALPFAVQNRIAGLSAGGAEILSRWGDACFDVVVAAVPTGPGAASALRRVLKPGGRHVTADRR